MPGSIVQLLTHSLTTLSSVACDLVRLLVLVSRSRRALAAENLFFRKLIWSDLVKCRESPSVFFFGKDLP